MRSYDEAKLRDAYRVFSEVFSLTMPYEIFVHKHIENPEYVEQLANLVSYEVGTPQGTNSFLGHVLVSDGERFFAVQSCDTAVCAEARGKGIFSSLIRQAMETARETDIKVIFGFPNKNSYPGFLKLGFHDLGSFCQCSCTQHPVLLAKDRLFKRTRPASLAPFGEMRMTDTIGNTWFMSLCCPFSDEDFRQMNHQTGIRVLRNQDYFHWKVDYLPEGETAYLYCRNKKHLCAYFVLRRQNERVYIWDWLLPEEKPANAIKFLRNALKPYAISTVLPMINSASTDFPVFLQGGFIRRSASIPLVAYFTFEPSPNFLNFARWDLRFLDADTTLNG